MAITLTAGWYPDPDDAATLRWWDGQAWTEKRQRTATIACAQCGADHLLPSIRGERGGCRRRGCSETRWPCGGLSNGMAELLDTMATTP